MKVSLITATYNSAQTIENCIMSVFKQSYKDIEYIIIDGQSEDETLEIIKSKKEKYMDFVIVSEKDRGIYDALNKGIKKATGDIIGFVHSDDFLAHESTIEAIVDTFLKYKVDGVYGDLHYVSINNTSKVVRNWESQPFEYKFLKQGWMPPHPTLYLKKSIYDTYGTFDLNYKIAADYDFILRIFKQKHLKFHYLPETIVKMRIGGASNRSIKNIIQKTNEDYQALRSNHLGNRITILLKNLSKIKQFFS